MQFPLHNPSVFLPSSSFHVAPLKIFGLSFPQTWHTYVLLGPLWYLMKDSIAASEEVSASHRWIISLTPSFCRRYSRKGLFNPPDSFACFSNLKFRTQFSILAAGSGSVMVSGTGLIEGTEGATTAPFNYVVYPCRNGPPQPYQIGVGVEKFSISHTK